MERGRQLENADTQSAQKHHDGAGHGTDANPLDDERTVEALYREMWRCMVDKDATGLAAVCADDFALHHMTGMRQSKRAFIEAVADGTLNYYETKHDAIEVSVDGDRARLVGRTHVLAAVFGGGFRTWRLEGSFDVRRENGTWKLIEEWIRTY